MEAVARIVDLVVPVCSELGFEVYDVELNARQLRVALERAGLGPGLDELAAVSHAISDALDAADADHPGGGLGLPTGYELEVTSPGLERRLRRPEHFQRAVGMHISGRTTPGTAGDRRFDGVLVAADAEGFTLEMPGARPARGRARPAGASQTRGATDASRHLLYDEIERAHTVFDWRDALGGRAAHEGPAPKEQRAEDGPPHPPVAAKERATNR